MSCLPRYAIILALGLSFGFASVVKSQTRAPKKPQTNSVSGRVTMHGKPAPGIIVGVRSADFSQPSQPMLKSTTDQEGNYQVINIPPGNYQVSPVAPALVSPDRIIPRGVSKTLILSEGEDVKDIDFSLVRGAVITGKVTDADGQPVVEERLTLSPENQSEQSGRGFPNLAGAFMTDDRGVYRIYGLPAGRYKISVGVSEQVPFTPVRFGRITYQRTFYPDAIDPADAKVIELAEGSEATNIDITVGRNLPGFSVSGKIVNGETDAPVAGVRFSLRRVINERDAGPPMGLFIASNQLGEFRMENITPGKYAVFVSSQERSELRAETVFFEVIDHDVTGLVVKTIPGFSIAGNVVLEGNHDKSVWARLTELRVRAFVRSEPPDFGSSHESAVFADGSFRIGGLAPGTANLSVSGVDRRSPRGFSIQRVERDGVVQQRGIEIRSGENVGGVKIVLSYGTGSIRGEVKLLNGPLAPGGNIGVWLTKPSDPQWRFRHHSVDARGHFVIEGVPAGEYELNVNANFPSVRATPTTKQLVHVTEGAVNNVEIMLDLKPGLVPN